MAAPRQPTQQGPLPRILDRLVAEKRLTRDQYDAVGEILRRRKIDVDEALFDATGWSEAELLKAYASVYKTRFVSTERLSKAQIDRATLELVPRKVVDRYNVVPILYDTANATLSVVIADPDNVQALEEVKLVSRVRSVAAFVARAAAVTALIKKIYQGDPRAFEALDRERPSGGAPTWGGNMVVDVFERQAAAAAESLGAANLKKHAGTGFPQQHHPPSTHPSSGMLELEPGGYGNIAEPPPPQYAAPPPQQNRLPTPVPYLPPGGKIPSLNPPAAGHPQTGPQHVPSLQMPAVVPQQARPPQPYAPPSPPPQPAFPSERPAPGVSMSAWLETLNVLVSLIENNRPDLRGHSAHVARLTRKFCERLGLAEKDGDDIVAAAFLHDLGKASSYHLTALNVAEYDGHKIAAEKSYLTPSRLMAGVRLAEATIRSLNHMYERFDGGGFPDALSGKDIPLGARVVAITDTYADLTQNPRNPYRKTLRPVEASDVLSKYKSAIFDNNLVDIFRHVVTGDDLKEKLLANRKSALIVDPDPEETTVLELRMIEQGFEVRIARGMDQALKAIAEGEFELVISEVDLTPHDGFQLLERARTMDNARNATWVFLSHRADREAIDRGFALGAADYVEKPVKAELLVAKLRKVVDQGNAGRAATSRGVSGSLEEMGFPELVQILSQGRKTGALKIRAGSETGELHFVAGDVYNALWGRLRGEDAFYSMCKLRAGEFSLDPNFKAETRVISSSAEGLLLEGMRRMDEEGRSE